MNTRLCDHIENVLLETANITTKFYSVVVGTSVSYSDAPSLTVCSCIHDLSHSPHANSGIELKKKKKFMTASFQIYPNSHFTIMQPFLVMFVPSPQNKSI
jgi:hypothetical protein